MVLPTIPNKVVTQACPSRIFGFGNSHITSASITMETDVLGVLESARAGVRIP